MTKIDFTIVCALLCMPAFAQSGGHCEDRCDAPGFDVSGFITGPNNPPSASVYIYDYSDPAVQSFADCLTTKLSGQVYSRSICDTSAKPVVWAPTNRAYNGTYNMKDANGKGLDPGRYLIWVVDLGEGDDASVTDNSGVAPGSWASKVVDIEGDLEYSVQLTPN